MVKVESIEFCTIGRWRSNYPTQQNKTELLRLVFESTKVAVLLCLNVGVSN